ncbi:two-component regulator propeller domain-containing protein [Winogradskyella sp.]|uniref:ligand-binding sensor domain-containing protein n=1 Tax=Winogradskyella sp. TaxID=1883156 RepID=UPI001B2DEBE8|nr:two-component regulator propeller domain-containing protein [Winogradskyella sp.]MBO6879447.1 helix-turn-helix domain-containing protein [Winogradskyella sp.]
MIKSINTILFLLLCTLTSAQSKIHFDKLDSEDGLSNNYISNLYEDYNGFIWISTQDGVNRFDGHEFITLRNSPIHINSVSANWIMNTTQDTEGNFWFGTYGEGFNRLDFKTNGISRFSKATISNGFNGSLINKIIATNNGDLWVLSDEGVHVKEKNEDVFKKIEIGNPWSRICKTEDGKIWIIDEEEVFLYNDETKKTELQFSLPESIINVEPIGNMLLSYSNEKVYISINKVVKKEVVLNDSIETTSNFKNGYGYIASKHKVYRYALETNSLEEVYKLNGENTIKSLLIDSKNQLWIGTTEGLLKENKLATVLKHLPIPYNARRIIHKNNTLYLGGNNGLHIINENLYKHELQNTNITSLYIDENTTIWAGDYKGNFYQIENQDTVIKHELKYEGINKSHIFGIVEDNKKRLWLGTWKGVYVFDKKGEILYFFRLNESNKDYNDKTVQMFSDSKDRLWIATSAHGLFKIQDFSTFDFSKDSLYIKNYRYNINHSNVLNSNIIFDVHEDGNGDIWIGTDAGLNFYDENSDGFNFLYNEGVLFDEKVMAIEHDYRNRLWVSSITKGVFVYDANNQSFAQYTTRDGLISNEFMFSASTSDSKGNLYFGTDKGIQVVNPKKLTDEFLLSKKPVITNFNIADNNPNILSNIFISSKEKVELKYPQNDFSISFSALEFTNTAKINYAYKLEGLDDSWKFVKNNQNTAYFTNIGKGTYMFKVKAFNAIGGITDGKETSLTIVVIPAWYNSNLAYIAYAIIFLGVLFFIFYLQLQKEIAQFKTQQIKHEEKVKLKKLITNFHYLGLSSIFSINDLETVKNNQSKIYGILSYFATSLFDKNKIDEVLWDITKNCISKLKLEDCVIYWINSNKSILTQRAAHGNKKNKGQDIVNPIDIPLGEGIVGTVALTGKPEIVADLTKDKRYIVDNIPRLSELAVPVFLNNEVVGVIDSEHSKKDFFTKGHLEIFQLIAVLLEKKLTQITDKSSLTITNDNTYFKELKQIMQQQKLYRNPTISLVFIADQLNISSGYLSRLINTLTDGNFNDFINTFRVNEVKRKLKNPEFDNYSILSIGLESGFNSKSVFYTTFKKQTGVSPSEFRKANL